MKFLQEGILIEERNFLLVWDLPVAELASKYGAVVEKQTDVYEAYWGENSFIEGSGINLRTPFIAGTLFQEMVYSIAGEHLSLRNFEVIKNHLLNTFGEPVKKNNNEDELIWVSPYVKVKLELEDYRGLKLYLVIKKNNDS